jgi:acetyl esterase
MQAILERLHAAPGVDYRTLPIAEARVLFDTAARPWNEGAPQIPDVRELTIPTGSMRARLYRPSHGDRLPVIVFVHGGGWTFGSIDTHDGTMRNLARDSGCAVLGFDYRLAPEHPFPAPLDDVLAALRFVEEGFLDDVDPDRIALAGDSAGANLALSALIARRRNGARPLAAAALFYGCYAPDFTTDSHARLGGGAFLLTTAMMQWYWRNFLGSEGDAARSLAVPLRADLSGLPPLYLNSAGLDPLLDDTVALAGRLAAVDAKFRHDHVPGVVHGFLRMTGELEAARRAIRAGAGFLAQHLDEGRTGGHER